MDISPVGHLIAFATEGSLVLQYILFFCLKGIVVKFSWNPQHKSELKQNSTHMEIKLMWVKFTFTYLCAISKQHHFQNEKVCKPHNAKL